MTQAMKRGLQVGVLTAVFVTGYLCGSVSQRNAGAEMGELGGAVMKQAGESGGALGSAAKLGTAIVDMQDHVSALQKNIDTLKGIKSALGG
ncbi:MAG: hypothetical protein HY271_09415 [Deltaproteobacteria bacterium]|nr:hypothetical protein [Deltaproteobacteria bacterium]